MNPDKVIIAFAIFSAVISFLPLVGVTAFKQVSNDDVYYMTEKDGKTTHEIVNQSTGLLRQWDINAFIWTLIESLFGLSLIAGLMKIAGISFSGGTLMSFAIFSVFFTLGVNAFNTITSVFGLISSGNSTVSSILTGMTGIFGIVFIYSIISFIRRISAGAYE